MRICRSLLDPSLLVPILATATACELPPARDGIDLFDVKSVVARDTSTDTPAIVLRLARATEGLLMMSESDHPFAVHHWHRPGGTPSAGRVAALAGEDARAVEELSVDEFFRAATTTHPENGPDGLATAQRFRDLVALLHSELQDLRVFRYGRIDIDAYVVGVTRSGDWVALSTKQVET